MTEQQYKELLETLGIGTGKSSADTKELLDAKYNEYLDRTDAEAEQMVSDIEDAMDYLEDLIVKMGGGIALAPEEIEETEEGSQNSFTDRTAGRKGAITYTSSSAVGSTTTGSGAQGGTTSAGTTSKPSNPWFYSTTGDKNIEDLFKLAEGDLAQGDYQHAESVYDTILRTEMTNVGAYMGKVLAKYSLQEPKDIATCYTDGLENDQDLMRAESCGNDKQKKFIQDALEERRQAMIYMEADKVLNTSWDVMKLLQAAAVFDSIATYRDSSKKADDCRKAAEHFREEERKRQEEEKKRQEEKQKKEEEDRKYREKERIRQQEEERRKKAHKKRRIILVIFLLCAVLVYVRRGAIEHALHFGNMKIEDKAGEYKTYHVADYPNVSSITAEDIQNLRISFCGNLKSVEANNVERMTITNCGQLREIIAKNTSTMRFEQGINIVSIETDALMEDIEFSLCKDMTKIPVLDNFEGTLTIDMCDSLTDLVIPEEFSGDLVIKSCDSLKNIDLPDDFTGDLAINYCNSLESLDLPDEYAGYIIITACNSLKDFEIPANAKDVHISLCAYLDDYTRHLE